MILFEEFFFSVTRSRARLYRTHNINPDRQLVVAIEPSLPDIAREWLNQTAQVSQVAPMKSTVSTVPIAPNLVLVPSTRPAPIHAHQRRASVASCSNIFSVDGSVEELGFDHLPRRQPGQISSKSVAQVASEADSSDFADTRKNEKQIESNNTIHTVPDSDGSNDPVVSNEPNDQNDVNIAKTDSNVNAPNSSNDEADVAENPDNANEGGQNDQQGRDASDASDSNDARLAGELYLKLNYYYN